jgi:hypothetical protein
MPDFGALINKAKELAGKHPDKVQDGVDKAEKAADDKLGGKYGDQVKQGGDKVEDFLGVDEKDEPEQR